MQVKNISARAWTIDGVILPPGETADFDDSLKDSLKGNKELEVGRADGKTHKKSDPKDAPASEAREDLAPTASVAAQPVAVSEPVRSTIKIDKGHGKHD